MSKMKLALDVVQDLRNLADSLEALAVAAISDAQPEAEEASISPQAKEQDSPKITIEELRASVAEKSTPDNRPRIKALLDKFGVKKLTELAEAQYAALMNEVKSL